MASKKHFEKDRNGLVIIHTIIFSKKWGVL